MPIFSFIGYILTELFRKHVSQGLKQGCFVLFFVFLAGGVGGGRNLYIGYKCFFYCRKLIIRVKKEN